MASLTLRRKRMKDKTNSLQHNTSTKSPPVTFRFQKCTGEKWVRAYPEMEYVCQPLTPPWIRCEHILLLNQLNDVVEVPYSFNNIERPYR